MRSPIDIRNVRRVNLEMREEIHDDQGRGALKSVPVYRVRFVGKPKKERTNV